MCINKQALGALHLKEKNPKNVSKINSIGNIIPTIEIINDNLLNFLSFLIYSFKSSLSNNHSSDTLKYLHSDFKLTSDGIPFPCSHLLIALLETQIILANAS